MRFPVLYAVVDVDACARGGLAPPAVAEAFLDAGVQLLQVRAKSGGAAAFLTLSRYVVACAARTRARVIVNDRPDVAVLAGAGGVHVGQDDLAAADARAIIGDDAWVGVSTHTLAQVAEALRQPVSYVAVGPVFATDTKDTGYDAVGPGLVAQVARLARPRGVPVVAIGGITLERAPGVLAAGADAVCVITDLLRGDPRTRARTFLETLGAARGVRP